MQQNKPSVGMLVTVRGMVCRITKIHAAFTIDVESVCGNYAFRVSGLSWK